MSDQVKVAIAYFKEPIIFGAHIKSENSVNAEKHKRHDLQMTYGPLGLTITIGDKACIVPAANIKNVVLA